MKTILKVMSVFLSGLAIVSIASCGQKVDKKELDKKVQASMESKTKPTFTDAEYEFMADYLYDHYKEISEMDLGSKDQELYMNYGFILLMAQMDGSLPPKAVEKYKKIMEKGGEYLESTEEVSIEPLNESDINWDEANEEVAIEAEYEY